MRVLITGGAGFIGSHLAEHLTDLGAQVLVIDDLSTGNEKNVPATADLARVSVTTPEAERTIASFAPEVVFHLAAQMNVRRSVSDPAFDTRTNVEGTVRVASASAQAQARCLLFASSGGAVYGEQETFPASEDHPTRSESPYGVAKRCGELYLEMFGRHSSMRTVHLRLANVYGPRQDPHGEAGVVAIFIQNMLEKTAPVVNGAGDQTRDYVYVADVVRAFLMGMRHSDASGPFNIGTGIETDVNTLAQRLADLTDYIGEMKHGPAKSGEQIRSVLDITRANRVLHWAPEVSLVQGLQETVRWFRGRSSASSS